MIFCDIHENSKCSKNNKMHLMYTNVSDAISSYLASEYILLSSKYHNLSNKRLDKFNNYTTHHFISLFVVNKTNSFNTYFI